MIKERDVNIMHSREISVITWVKQATVLKFIEVVVERCNTTIKEVTPKSLDSLVMHTSTCNNTPSVWTPLRVIQHVMRYPSILTSLITLSLLTLDGKPYYLSTAWGNTFSTVETSLLVAAARYTISREKPSIPPWVTILHRVRLWYPSTFHRLLGPATEYCCRCNTCLCRRDTPWGSVQSRLSRTLCLDICNPKDRK